MGVAMGVAIGVAIDNVGAGIAIGVAIGAGLGSTGAFESKNLDPEDPGGLDESGISAESGDLGDQASEGPMTRPLGKTSAHGLLYQLDDPLLVGLV